MNRIVLFLLSIGWFGFANAQQELQTNFSNSKDSLYYDPLGDYLTLKFLVTNKYSDFEINDALLNQTLVYKSKPSNAIGFGAAYRWLNFSLSLGLKNRSDSVDETKRSIDFQTAIYMRRLTINLYSGIYTGYYLENSAKMITDWDDNDNYHYVRNDITTNTFGVGFSYLFNSEKYSNKSSFVQKEWQKKTAGSFLTGGSIIRNEVRADSSFIPTNISDSNFYKGIDFNHSSLFKVGAEGGYAFTYVLKEHFFFNFSVLAGISYGKTKLTPLIDEEISAMELNFTLLNSAGFGYNSKLFFVGFNYTNLFSKTPSPIQDMNLGYSSGKFQLVAAYRFKIPEHKSILPAWIPIQL
ncbi:MAG: DUF4421 family protein [Salinivirgaceae bacterium]